MPLVKDIGKYCGSYRIVEADKLGLQETGYLILDEQKNFIPLNIALLTLHYKGKIPKGIVFTHWKKPALLSPINDLYPILANYFGDMDYRFFNIYVYLDANMKTKDDKVGYRIDIEMKQNEKILNLVTRMIPLIAKVEDDDEKRKMALDLNRIIENMSIST